MTTEAMQALTDQLSRTLSNWPLNGQGGKIHVYLILGSSRQDRTVNGFFSTLMKANVITLRKFSWSELPENLKRKEGVFILEHSDKPCETPFAYVEAPSLSTRCIIIDKMTNILNAAERLTRAANLVAKQ